MYKKKYFIQTKWTSLSCVTSYLYHAGMTQRDQQKLATVPNCFTGVFSSVELIVLIFLMTFNMKGIFLSIVCIDNQNRWADVTTLAYNTSF